jgi:RecA-family ATPase
LAVRNESGIKTAAELLNTQFPEIRWIVPGLIGEGLTMINGAPKIGKSWFVLNLAIAAAMGGTFLGNIKTQQTDTLYLALEDKERRMHYRLKKLNSPKTGKLKITTKWRDGYTGLESYLKANTGIGLVIIDTLARFTNINDINDYSITTNAMTRLKQIADDLNIAVILIHHTRKTGSEKSGVDWMESALGSTGLTGATDSTIFICRNRSDKETKNTATLYATGRDTADIKHSLKLDLDCGGWVITNAKPSGKDKETDDEGTGLDYDWDKSNE